MRAWKSRTGSLLLVLSFVVGPLAGCVGSPRYARYSEAEGATPARLTDPVEYRIDTAAARRSPSCVAVLPLALAEGVDGVIELPRVDVRPSGADSEDQPEAYQRHLGPTEKQRLVRRMLYGFVSPHSPRDIELERIDRLIGHAPPLGTAARKNLGRRLNCDWLLTGTITRFELEYLGLYSNILIGLDLSLVHAGSGRVFWSGRHLAQSRNGAVPLSPLGVAVGAVMAARNLEPDQLEGVVADVARRLVRTMPLDADNVFLSAARHRQVYEVATTRLNLRSGPGVRYEVRRVLEDSQLVSMIDSPGQGWCKVRTPDGETGFVAVRYLRQSLGDRDS